MKDNLPQLDAENQALNALIADNNLLSANTLDSLDHPKSGNGFAKQLPFNHKPMIGQKHSNDHLDKIGDSASGRLYEIHNTQHTQNGQDETDMRDVCLESDTVDGVNETNDFHGFIHDGMVGMYVRLL